MHGAPDCWDQRLPYSVAFTITNAPLGFTTLPARNPKWASCLFRHIHHIFDMRYFPYPRLWPFQSTDIVYTVFCSVARGVSADFYGSLQLVTTVLFSELNPIVQLSHWWQFREPTNAFPVQPRSYRRGLWTHSRSVRFGDAAYIPLLSHSSHAVVILYA